MNLKTKMNIRSLLKDQNVLYVVLFLAVTNLFGYLLLQNFDAIVFFLVVGFLTSYFSKNMIVVMLVAMISTNFLVGTKQLGIVTEGMSANRTDATKDAKDGAAASTDGDSPTADAASDDAAGSTTAAAASDEADSDADEVDMTITDVETVTIKDNNKDKGKDPFTRLSPAPVGSVQSKPQGKGSKLDYAATLEAAYDNLDKMLGSDAIKSMSNDTQRLAKKQQQLMGNIEKLEPMMAKADTMLKGLDMGKIGNMITGLQDKMSSIGS